MQEDFFVRRDFVRFVSPARRLGIHQARSRASISSSMGCRIAFTKFKDRVANGPPEMQDTTPGSQRVLHAHVSVQFDTQNNRDRGVKEGSDAVSNQFQGCVTNAHEFPGFIPRGHGSGSMVHSTLVRDCFQQSWQSAGPR